MPLVIDLKVESNVSEEQYGSKRERQKARRAERLEREAQTQRVDNRKRQMVYGLAALVALGLIGLLIFSQITERREVAAQAEEVTARLEELGCTDDITMPNLGGGHIDPPGLAAEAPEVIYAGGAGVAGEPPSSGRHLGQVVATGVYDVPIDPRVTTHNLEHGYIVVHYAADAPAEQVSQMKAWAQEQIDGDFPRIVVTEYYKDLPDDANFSYTAWLQRQTCDTFDPDVAEVFTRAHHGTNGQGPEKDTTSVHSEGQQGVLSPDGEPLFLPPLDALFGESALDEVEEAEPASPTRDADTGSEAPAEAETPSG